MNALEAFRLRAFHSSLLMLALVGLLSNRAQAFHQYFDVNGTASGSGVADGGSYTWEGANWNNNNATGTAATIPWTDGAQFARFSAGTDGNNKSYTITANVNHTIAGMVLQTGGGGNGTGKFVTLAAANGSILTLASNAGGQGIFVGGTSDQNLVITAPIAGDAVTAVVWQGQISGTTPGSLFLYGGNTFAGGVKLDTPAALNFNNANSFGSGPISWGFDSGSTQYAVSAPALAGPVSINNQMMTRSASTLIMADFAQPVTWGGAWTLAAGTSTLDVRSNANTTISGIIGGANSTSALTKISPGKLTLTTTNTYAGGTTVSGGTLELSGAAASLGTGNVSVTGTGASLLIDGGVSDAISNSATLSLANNGVLNLAAGVNERVGFLSLDTALQPNTTYGSSQSNAVVKLDLYFSGTGILTVGSPILAGDYNNDGVVNAADYVVWKKNIGQPSQTLPNDTTGVIVGQPQYDLWRSNFGSTAAVPGSGSLATGGAVPEPSSIVLLMVSLTGLVAFARRRRTNGISRE